MSDLERGVRRYPYRDTRQRLADALGLDDAQRAAMHVGARVSGLRLRAGGVDNDTSAEAAGRIEQLRWSRL